MPISSKCIFLQRKVGDFLDWYKQQWNYNLVSALKQFDDYNRKWLLHRNRKYHEWLDLDWLILPVVLYSQCWLHNTVCKREDQSLRTVVRSICEPNFPTNPYSNSSKETFNRSDHRYCDWKCCWCTVDRATFVRHHRQEMVLRLRNYRSSKRINWRSPFLKAIKLYKFNLKNLGVLGF